MCISQDPENPLCPCFIQSTGTGSPRFYGACLATTIMGFSAPITKDRRQYPPNRGANPRLSALIFVDFRLLANGYTVMQLLHVKIPVDGESLWDWVLVCQVGFDTLVATARRFSDISTTTLDICAHTRERNHMVALCVPIRLREKCTWSTIWRESITCLKSPQYLSSYPCFEWEIFV